MACLKGAPELLHFNDDAHFLLPGFDFTNIIRIQMAIKMKKGRKRFSEPL